ncbi:MAG: phosphonate metabolism protein/1,5-bisphosphokinase (PRPP-forming) PhnN [Alphaproteobacteria bacterium]
MRSRTDGTLFLVVGPSGAGKDTLIAYAAGVLSATHAFPRRVVTRPADAGGEDHEAMSAEAFAALAAAGGFALTWRAHGLRYGIRSDIGTLLAAGRHVVCNVSRSVVDEARQRFRTLVVAIEASPAVRARRLLQRGRETPEDVAARLERRVDAAPDATIRNEGTVADACARFVTILSERPHP